MPVLPMLLPAYGCTVLAYNCAINMTDRYTSCMFPKSGPSKSAAPCRLGSGLVPLPPRPMQLTTAFALLVAGASALSSSYTYDYEPCAPGSTDPACTWQPYGTVGKTVGESVGKAVGRDVDGALGMPNAASTNLRRKDGTLHGSGSCGQLTIASPTAFHKSPLPGL